MDSHFLILLRKDDIIDFYKYGRWNALCPNIKFDGDIDVLSQNSKLMEKLFKQSNPFDYSMEYFLVHILCPKLSSCEVDDIQDIFPLDGESYKMGLALSPEVRLSKPLFEKSYIEFQIRNEIIDAKKGVEHVFSIFELECPKSIFKKGELEAIIRDSLLENPIKGEQSILYYLLRYERHQSYPKDNRGFFLDAIHAFYDFEKKTDMDISVVQSKIGHIIAEQEPKVRYKEILSIVELQKDFLKHCEKAKKGYYRFAPLFLMLKSTFIDGIRDDVTYCNLELSQFVKAMKDGYDNKDLTKALYLLGVALGREYTYQHVYKMKRIPILK